MSLLSPSPQPHPAADLRSSVTPDSGIVHVAVGRSIPQTLALLQWTFRQFDCREIVLLHIHQPSPMIPTLSGKLPVNHANEGLAAEYRRTERMEMEKILKNYWSFCYRAQVHPRVIVDESRHVHQGIVDSITRFGIRKLVMGVTSDNCFKVKGRSNKMIYTAKYTIPHFCEVWFVRKGKHLWTREAMEGPDAYIPFLSRGETTSRERMQSSSSERMVSSELYSKELEGINNHSKEVTMEFERSKIEALEEFAMHRELEIDVAKAFNREIMSDPQVAADGFSYEGKALREWLENGRGTSPMTNLELDHLNLTPNHALKFAIQDWLCQPCQS